jgi:hypothetical protein
VSDQFKPDGFEWINRPGRWVLVEPQGSDIATVERARTTDLWRAAWTDGHLIVANVEDSIAARIAVGDVARPCIHTDHQVGGILGCSQDRVAGTLFCREHQVPSTMAGRCTVEGYGCHGLGILRPEPYLAEQGVNQEVIICEECVYTAEVSR